MDLEQLRQLICVARHGNITRAAEELGLSQPALSRSMQRLEEEFGRPLLERKPRCVSLTDAGTLLQSRAEEVLALLEDTRARLRDDGQSGRLRIGAIPTVAPYFLPPFLRCFRDDFPDAELIIQEDTTNALLARCGRGELDLAVLALPIAAKHIDSVPLFEEELLLVLSADHPLADQNEIRLADIEPLPFVLLNEAHCLTDNVVTFCRQRDFQPLVVERTSQIATVQELVSLGHGVSMIPTIARRLDESKTRVYRSLDGRKPKRTIAAAWNPYRFESRLLLSLREKLVEYSERFGVVMGAVE